MPQEQHIAIIGYGIAGAACAQLLARQGHKISVFEQSSDLSAKGAGILLQPSGQAVLKKMNIYLDDIAQSHKISKIDVQKTYDQGQIFELSYDQYGKGIFSYGASRGDVFMSIHQANIAPEKISITLKTL